MIMKWSWFQNSYFGQVHLRKTVTFTPNISQKMRWTDGADGSSDGDGMNVNAEVDAAKHT